LLEEFIKVIEQEKNHQDGQSINNLISVSKDIFYQYPKILQEITNALKPLNGSKSNSSNHEGLSSEE